MKHIIPYIGAVALFFSYPSASFGQTMTAAEEFQTPLVQTIVNLLHDRIQDLTSENEALKMRIATLENGETNACTDTDISFSGAVEPAAPTVEVSFTQADVGSDGEPDETGLGRKFIFMRVRGDFDESYEHVWNEDEEQLIYTGFNRGTDKKYEITNAPIGKYRWEVVGRKDGVETRKEGVFVVE